MEVRRIRPAEVAPYREMRLRALTLAPEAYGTTLEDALSREYEDWEGMVLRAATAAGFALFVLDRGDGRLAGSAAAFVEGDAAEPQIIQMWLDEDLRGAGWAEQLLAAAEAHVRALGHPSCVLWVADGNDRARRLYHRCGYALTGVQGDNGRGGLEHQMRKHLAE